jgi:hypothetical protein
MIAPAAAFEHQGSIGVVRVKELRHGNLFSWNTIHSEKKHYANNGPTLSQLW